MKRLHIALIALALAAPLAAQDQKPAAASAPAPAPVAPAAPAAPPVSVDEAYRKEFAFLSAQKRELAAQLEKQKAAAAQQQAALNNEIAALEARVLSLDTESQNLAEQTTVAEESAIANEETSSLLEATFAQAASSMEALGDTTLGSDAFNALPDGEKTTQMFALAAAKLAALSTVRKEPGKFFLADGTEVEGQLVRIGNIAVYGISDRGTGALAPAAR